MVSFKMNNFLGKATALNLSLSFSAVNKRQEIYTESLLSGTVQTLHTPVNLILTPALLGKVLS